MWIPRPWKRQGSKCERRHHHPAEREGGANTIRSSPRADKHPTKVLAAVVDVAIAAQVDAWVESIVAEFGRLDGAANIAGLCRGNPETDSSNIVGRPGAPKALSLQLIPGERPTRTGTRPWP